MYIEQFTGEYRWLSNFYLLETPYEHEGISYKTVEHFYVAMKTTDMEVRKTVSELNTPGKAKRFGRKKIELREDWDRIKDSIMIEAVRYKFSHNNQHLRYKLKNTGSQLIEEGNEYEDYYWGVDLWTGEGKNKLGEIIMKVRQEIINERFH